MSKNTIPAPTIKTLNAMIASWHQPRISDSMFQILSDALTGGFPIQPLALTGYAGLGKTYVAGEIAKFLEKNTPENRVLKFIPVQPNCTNAQLREHLIRNCEPPEKGPGKCVVFFFDEAHNLPEGTRNLLKTVTETSGKSKTFSLPAGQTNRDIVIDPTRHFFIIATNESLQDSALVGASGRFSDLQFLPYDREGIIGIMAAAISSYLVKDRIENVKIPTGKAFLDFIIDNVRPFARSINEIVKKMRIFALQGNKLLSVADAKKFLQFARVFPQGYTQDHIDILIYIGRTPAGRQVQEIAQSALHGADTNTAKGFLVELMQGRLIITLNNGRKGLTEEGRTYLKSLSSDK